MTNLNEVYQQILALLPEAEHEALWLCSHFSGLPKRDVPHSRQPLPPKQTEQLLAAARRRAAGEPLQYITGLQPFWDFELIVTPDVLIPRWDSEAVLEQALKLLPKQAACRAADICTGSGAYALTIKKERPLAAVTACDISEAALAIARQNAAKYNLDIDFRQGDLLSPLGNAQAAPKPLYDLIVSNPPYVEDAAALPPDVQQEPALALFGGPDGLDFYRRLTAEGALAYLKPCGYLLLEIGCEQAPAVGQLLEQSGFINIQTGQDLAGLNRWIQGQRPNDHINN